SFSIPSLLLLILAAVAGGLFTRAAFLKRQEASEGSAATVDESSEEESFELSKLLEATMRSMREGLLVVDRDMRVVASNVSARLLFNSSSTKLESQRLTPITRKPAIYGAFL